MCFVLLAFNVFRASVFVLLAFDTGSNGPARGHLYRGQIHRARHVLRHVLLREVRPCCCASIGLREGRSSNGVRHLVFALFAATAPLSRSECCGRRWRRLVSSAAAQRTTASAVRQRFAAGERLLVAKPRARHAPRLLQHGSAGSNAALSRALAAGIRNWTL